METGTVSDILKRYVRAANVNESERFWARLLTEHAEPIVTKIVRYKTRGGQNSFEWAASVVKTAKHTQNRASVLLGGFCLNRRRQIIQKN